MTAVLELEKNLAFLPPRLLFCSYVTQVSDGRLHWRPLAEKEVFSWPAGRADFSLTKRLQKVDQIFSSYAQKYPVNQVLPKDNKRFVVTKEIVKDLFPGLLSVIKDGQEEKFFHGKKAEEYVDQVALLKAKEFLRWLVGENILDEAVKRKLLEASGLEEVLDTSLSFLDLVRNYQSRTVSVGDDQKEAVIYDARRQQQIQLVLGLTYLYALVDLARDPKEEDLLLDFAQGADKAFPQEAVIDFYLRHNQNGKSIGHALVKPSDDEKYKAQVNQRFQEGEFDFHTRQPVRRIVDGDTALTQGFVFFDFREKTPFSEMLKIMRGRPVPVEDRHGIRFIIDDSRNLDVFIRNLKEKMPEWTIEREQKETKTASSTKPPGAKYFAWRKDQPSVKIEMQVEWYTARGCLTGGYLAARYNRDDNEYAFRVRQLFEGILQKIFPEEIYQVKWDDSLKTHLISLANGRALASVIQDKRTQSRGL